MKSAIIVSCYDNYDYDTRTKYVEKLLEKKGYEVEFLVADFDHRNKKTYSANRGSSINYIHVLQYNRNLSLKRVVSNLQFSRQAGQFLKKSSYDLIYLCAPPNSSISEIAKVKKRKKFKLITEIGDLWPETMPLGKREKAILFIPFFLWAELRDRYLKYSDYVITECNLFRQILEKRHYYSDIKTLYFCKDFNGPSRHNALSDSAEIRLLYLGSINNIIDIDQIRLLIEKLAALRNVSINIIGDGEKREELLQSAKSAGAKVNYYGSIFDESEKKKIAENSHFALNIMKPEVCVGMTMKSLDYFSAGIPIINNIGSDTWDLVKNYSVGFNINLKSTSEVAETIARMNEAEYSQMLKNVARAHSSFFSIESFESQLTSIINKIEASC